MAESPLAQGECAGLSTLNEAQKAEVERIVDEALAKQPEGPGLTHLIEHHIRVAEERPSKHKMRRYSDAVLKEARRTVEKWSVDGVIEPLASDYSSAPVLVKKSDGTYRMCIDYRGINARTGRFDGCVLDKLRGAKYIFKIHLKNAYLQVPMDRNSKKYTAFSVPGKGLYHFRTMPFGLTNAPATFCRLVDAPFGPEFEPNVFTYLDVIIIVSSTYEEHLKWLKFV